MKEERSYGAVVFTRAAGETRYVIVENLRGGHYGFPKGHIEEGESERETALREIFEETALAVHLIDGFRREERYALPGGKTEKAVVYFLAEFEGQQPKAQENEIGAVALLPLDKALSLLTFESARRVLSAADGFIKMHLKEGVCDMEQNKNRVEIVEYTENRIADLLDFERRLREEEDVWGWEIDDAYIDSVGASFHDRRFEAALSYLAYLDGKVVGRIDASLVPSRFDGSVKAYLDWICVIKSARHRGIGQALLEHLRAVLKGKGIGTLVALTAANEEAQRFYKALPRSEMHDVGIWIEI